ncbi:MAG: ornithine cyclodeaminase family protein [Kiloniellales bacterium]|nr:ornithine cyclodeaminase family protein [Kiloniellales bacterium]
MTLGQDILYLSNADIEACGLGLADVEMAVETMFASKAEGRAVMKPKLALHAPDQALFLASPGVMDAPAYGGVKWVGVAGNEARGLPHIAGLILLSDAETGMPLSVMDARWITGVRTAAITAVAARRLARRDSATIGFVACGLQARAHLAALRPHFPLCLVRAYSRRLTTAKAFAEEVRAEGLDAEAVMDPRDAVAEMDIVVTSTPVVPRTEPLLDAAWLEPGSFASLVDLGFSWVSDTLTELDRVVTDDQAQAGTEGLAYKEPYAGEVADLVVGRLAARQSPEERTALVFAGLGLADVAVAGAVYKKALAAGIGRTLPL